MQNLFANSGETGFSAAIDSCFYYNYPVAPSDSCFDAPPFCDSFLNGFCSVNEGYNSDAPGNLQDVFNCPIDNNQWLTFMACDPAVTFDFNVENCNDGEGLEFGIFQTDDCSNFISLVNCTTVSSGNTGTISLNNLQPGIRYFLMVDGINGDVCQWKVTGLEGAAGEAYIQEDIIPGSIDGECDICLGVDGPPSDAFTYTVTGPECNLYSVDTTCAGDPLPCVPAPQLLCEPHLDTLYNPVAWDTIWYIDPPEAGYFVNDDSTGSMVNVVWDSVGTFYLEVNIKAIEWDTVPFWNDCMGYCEIICPDLEGDDCKIERKEINVGQPDEFHFFVEKCPEECVPIQLSGSGGTSNIPPTDTIPIGGPGTIEFCAPGTYEFFAYDDAGCVDEYTVEIIDFIPEDEYHVIQEICPGECAFFQGQVYCPGTYFIPFIDNNGCLATIFLDVLPAEEIIGDIIISGDHEITCNNPTALLIADVTIAGPVSYAWSTGGFGQTINVDFGGLFTVTVFDLNGCYVGEASFFVEENNEDEEIDLGEIILCLGECFPLEGNDYCDEGDYQEEFIDPLTGCKTTYIFTIVIENEPSLSIGPVTEICDGINENYTVGFTINISPGDTYTVNGTPHSGSFYQSDPIPSGDPYSFTIQAANQCGAAAPQLVQSAFECLCISEAGSMASAAAEYCEFELTAPAFNNDAVFDDNDVLSFVLHDGSGNLLGNIIGINSTGIFGFDAGSMQYGTTYYISPVVGNNDNGTVDLNSVCLSVGFGQPVVFYENPSLLIAPPDELNCNHPSEILETTLNGGTGLIDYAWTGPGGFQSNDSDPTVGMGGSYTCTITDLISGCQYSESVFVEEDFAIPSLELSSSGIIDCNHPTAELNAISNLSDVTFEWTNPDGEIFQGENISIQTGGGYSVTVTASNGCSEESFIDQAEDIDPPFLQASDGLIDCENTAAILSGFSGEPGVTFQWILLNGDTTDGISITAQQSGEYTVIAMAPNGCISEEVAMVETDTVSPDLEILAGQITCADPSITLEAVSNTAGVEINWIFPTGNETNGATTVTDIPGNYTTTALAPNGCSTTLQTEVTSNNDAPVFSVNNGQIDCEQTADTLVVVTDSTNIEFSWELPNGDEVSGDTLLVTLAGDYLVTATSLNGCSSEVMASVVDNSLPPDIDFDYGEIDCLNANTVLTASSNMAGVEFTWTFPNGNTLNGAMITTSVPGNYTLNATADNGCSVIELFEVIENSDPPVLEVNGEDIFCSNPEATLIASSNNQNVVYNWLLPDNSMFNGTLLNTDLTGNYLVTATGLNGCTSTETIVVDSVAGPPIEITAELQPPLCYGDTNGYIIVGDVIGAAGDLLVTLNGQLVELPEINNLSAGLYELNIVDENGCEGTAMIELEEPQEVVVDLGDDLFLIKNEVFDLGYQSNIFPTNITWQGPNGQIWEGVESISLVADASVEYEITVFDENDCSASDALLVFVEGSGEVYVPNAFSPNGDDTNDYLTVFSGGDVEEVLSFKIFDRWGNLVFSRENFAPNNEDLGWDGTFKNKKMNSAVFAYMAEVAFKTGESKMVVGDVILLD
ncbi:MAG: gliding motility-associated C-terminal domain-containing protein [Bacteroidota bacterium]